MIQRELHAIQHEHGYLPAEALRALSARRNVPLRRLHEVASCFPHYRLTPPAVEVKVCRDMACHLRGASEYLRGLKALADEIGPSQGAVAIGGVSCLGQCDGAVAVVIGPTLHRGKTLPECRALLRDALTGTPGRSARVEDRIAPTGWRIDPYDGREDYSAAQGLRREIMGAR